MAQNKKQTKTTLAVDKRKVTGRKVKKLRREGVLPANIYGKGIKSLAVRLALKEFTPIYQKVGETGIVELKVKGETKVRPVLIHNLQLDSVTDQPLHADFYQVNLKEKITTDIPVEMIGEAPAVVQKIGVLIQPLVEVEVEALPTNLPEKLSVNISKLEKVDDAVAVEKLKVPAGVKILTGAKQILVKIEPFAKEEEKPAAEEAPAEGEEAAAEPTEGEEKAPVEQEAKETEKTAAEKPEKKESKREKPQKK